MRLPTSEQVGSASEDSLRARTRLAELMGVTDPEDIGADRVTKAALASSGEISKP
jgi:hypothetical protein